MKGLSATQKFGQYLAEQKPRNCLCEEIFGTIFLCQRKKTKTHQETKYTNNILYVILSKCVGSLRKESRQNEILKELFAIFKNESGIF